MGLDNGDTLGNGLARHLRVEVSSEGIKLVPIETDLFCPISTMEAKDPVLTVDGALYDREHIHAWFCNASTSPLTGLPLQSKKLVSVESLKDTLEAYMNQRPEITGWWEKAVLVCGAKEESERLREQLHEQQAFVRSAQEDSDKLKTCLGELHGLQEANELLLHELQESQRSCHDLRTELTAALEQIEQLKHSPITHDSAQKDQSLTRFTSCRQRRKSASTHGLTQSNGTEHVDQETPSDICTANQRLMQQAKSFGTLPSWKQRLSAPYRALIIVLSTIRSTICSSSQKAISFVNVHTRSGKKAERDLNMALESTANAQTYDERAIAIQHLAEVLRNARELMCVPAVQVEAAEAVLLSRLKLNANLKSAAKSELKEACFSNKVPDLEAKIDKAEKNGVDHKDLTQAKQVLSDLIAKKNKDEHVKKQETLVRHAKQAFRARNFDLLRSAGLVTEMRALDASPSWKIPLQNACEELWSRVRLEAMAGVKKASGSISLSHAICEAEHVGVDASELSDAKQRLAELQRTEAESEDCPQD